MTRKMEEPLPKLPVPKLEDTLDKYLKAVEPLVSKTQFDNTKAIVREFGSSTGLGPKLQEFLIQRREMMDNWANEYWLNDLYLNVALPLPVLSSPGGVFSPQQFKLSSITDLAFWGAAFVDACLTRKEVLDRKELPVDRATSREKGQPLCMSNYYSLFTSYRVPGTAGDRIISTMHQEDNSAEHIIIIHKNQLYSLVVKNLASDGKIIRLTIPQIAHEIVKILEAPQTTRAVPIGLLTAHKRDAWATARDLLRQDTQNADNLEVIEKSILVLCIDELLPESFNFACPSSVKLKPLGYRCGQRDETSMAHQMLHGGGSLYNGGNRWYDKTVQIVMSKDGVVGAVFEHAASDGVVMHDLGEYAIPKIREAQAEAVETEDVQIPEGMTATQMNWNISLDVQRHIHDAARGLDIISQDLDCYIYRFTNFGEKWIKNAKCSPDAFIQMALQLASYKLYGNLVATEAGASTRRFRCGRMDCIRSATMETLRWAQSMVDGEDEDEGKRVTFTQLDDTKRLELFDTAMKKQTEITVDNILGQGIDIHLLGLRKAACELTGGLPPIFLDETYRIANQFVLSTSQMSTRVDIFSVFGPFIAEGIGVPYNPKPDSIIFPLVAWHSCARTSTWHFAKSLDYALNAMRRLLSIRDPSLK